MKVYYIPILFLFCSFSEAIGQDEKQVPDFSFLDVQGKSVSNTSIESIQGMFMYFDPLCDVCAIEMKVIKSHQKYFQDKLIYLISPGKREDIEKFIDQHHLAKYPFITVIHDKNDDFYRSFKTNGYPSLFVFNSSSEITASFSGETPFEEIKNAFEMNTNAVYHQPHATPIAGF